MTVLPERNQLKVLLKTASDYDKKVLNALVVNKDDHTLLAFRDQKPLSSLDLTPEITEEIFCPFNGTFILRSVIEKIGFIKKEMFIWGDEGEYMCRIKKNGYHLYTATRAIHYHPKEKGNKNYAIPIINKGRILLKPEKMSHYYYRNLGYNAWHYGTILSVIKQCLLHTTFFVRTGRFAEMKKSYKYYYKGITNDYSK